ncbi:L-cystine transporter [Vagococcus penaei]|uniref:L-cystine uptake protein TcyP n=1 Tax=Vagococcus penaei TaxID=633807 RepID=A0A1Q2D549_9ENTE|nr:cation:dicarboxylase symporter family transporter [Vagococcus penaei]AQP53518.1 L-cystine transporter [Vagococcus penaei]RSU07462.1 L-cystine transporter [Vagococcus penaei]
MTHLLPTVSVIIVFLAIMAVLYRMKAKHVKFSKRVFIALGIGLVFGIVLQFIFGNGNPVITNSIDWISIVGNGYVAFLQMLIMPLIFISIVGAFTKLTSNKNLGKISFSVLGTLIGTTAIAALIGILVVFLFNLDGATFTKGAAETARIAELTQRQDMVKDLTIPQQIVSFIPRNIFADLAGSRETSTIAVVIFSALVGIAYLGMKKKETKEAEFFLNLIQALDRLVMQLVKIVLRLTPYGILALMTKMSATSDLAAIIDLGKFVVASYVAIITMFIIHLLILLVNRVNPITYLKKAFPVLSFAFSSRSSAGALPLNIETQRKALGVDDATANFAASFGLSIGQNGCAGIYPAMLAAIVAPTVGIDVHSISYIIVIIAVVSISSFGVAGVGGGATFASLIVLGSLNLPVEIVGLVISVEPLIDMGRTALNVSGSMLAGVTTSRHLKELDDSVLNDPNAVVDAH